ncbi:MAG: hypothetical protein M1830_004041 [Pleopsidium flavum]|nr:MAG: hypothetical protein M1830_004041 [Pleopsidium flavum]
MAAQSDKLSFLESISPWGPSRSTTPKLGSSSGDAGRNLDGLGKQQGGDHTVPKRKPLPLDKPPFDAKLPPPPKKFVAFTAHDSRSIEHSFQKLVEEDDAAVQTRRGAGADDLGSAGALLEDTGPSLEFKRNTSINDATNAEKGGRVKVPVNEDFLFDVDIEQRELAPTYWLGPIYQVRRGSWFYQEGSSLRPCEENLASQLEEGYLKIKPWRSQQQTQRSASQPRSELTARVSREDPSANSSSNPATPRASIDILRGEKPEEVDVMSQISPADSRSRQAQLQTHRLFGTYMNSAVTYQDAAIAWLLTDDFLSRMSSTVYERFAGGGHLGGTKMVRGYREPGKPVDSKDASADIEKGPPRIANPAGGGALNPFESSPANYKRRSAPPSTSAVGTHDVAASLDGKRDVMRAQGSDPAEDSVSGPVSEVRRQALERQMSSLVTSGEPQDPEMQEEEVRKRDEKEISDDYRDTTGEDQAREIEHLILVTHGIGQRLGLRMESVNFVHDVNVLRKTLKTVYSSSADLQALNSEVARLPNNCRVQVLPICWRHLLDFPKQSLKQNRKEQDLADIDELGEDEEYPSLDDITVEGVPAVRNLITDLALDILLYQSAYREHISGIVQRECNRVYQLFLERNPSFKGKVSLIGHSLGSAILFDILSRQKEPSKHPGPGSHKHLTANRDRDDTGSLSLDFDVDGFFCLGSPIGLFQMLQGRTIAGRRGSNAMRSQNPTEPDARDDPFLGPSSRDARRRASIENSNILTIATSSPKCQELYNIFHPTDPISYRIEPLISPAMSSMQPQPLPYTKKGIFGVPGQGLTGIGARVGQSVSGFWSNLTSGVASSLLNRSLGLTGDDAIMTKQPMAGSSNQQMRIPLSLGAGTNISGGGVISSAESVTTGEESGQHPPTLIDSEIETLFAGFQKRRKSHQSDESRDLGESAEWQEAEKRGRRLQREEGKVRALNSNGRVDYSIQE